MMRAEREIQLKDLDSPHSAQIHPSYSSGAVSFPVVVAVACKTT